MTLGPVDLARLSVGPMLYDAQQGLFILVWLLVAGCLLVTRNIMRSRAGRALTALRDFELAATVAGVNPARAKVAAFGAAGALAGLSGALLVAQLRQRRPGVRCSARPWCARFRS